MFFIFIIYSLPPVPLIFSVTNDGPVMQMILVAPSEV